MAKYDDISVHNNSFHIDAGYDVVSCADQLMLNAEPAELSQANEETTITGYGVWEILSGNAQIDDSEIHNECALVTGLEPMMNKFRWTVFRNSCQASDEVEI